MDSFLIKSFKDGISEYEDKGLPGSFKFGSNLDIRKKKDSLSAQQALTDDLQEGTFASLGTHIVVSADGNSYFAVGTKIYERTSAGVYSLQHTDAAGDGNINGMWEWINDAGDTFLYYTTNTRLNRKRLLGSSYTPGDHDDPWDDVNATVNSQTYPKTNLTSATWHTMRVVNGSLLICNKGALAKVGYDDSYTNEAVVLHAVDAKSLIESGIIAKVITNQVDVGGKATIFIWDTDDQNYTDKLALPFKDVNAIVETEIGIVQYGTDGKLYFYGDSTKLPVMALPEGGQVYPEGVDEHDGLALLGVFGNGVGYSGIYTYGRKFKNANLVLNCEYQFDCDAIGAVKVVGDDILFTYQNGSDYGVKKVNTAGKATKAIYQSLDLKAPDKLQRPATWNHITLTMDSLPSGCSVEVWRRADKKGSFVKCNLEGGDQSYTYLGATEATFLIGDKAKYLEIQIVLNCTANLTPEIYKAQVFFE